MRGLADVVAAGPDRARVVDKARALAKELGPLHVDWYPGGVVRGPQWIAWSWVPEDFAARPYAGPEDGYLSLRNIFLARCSALGASAPAATVE